MRIGCIIQARLGSERLPRKVVADIGGWPMIRHVYERIARIHIPLVVMTPVEDSWEIFKGEGCEHNPANMLRAYLVTAQKHSFDAVMRVTGDCPLIDPGACEQVMRIFLRGEYDYVANDYKQFARYPDGMGCEVFHTWCLKDADANAKSGLDREHVTPWIIRQAKAGEYSGRHVSCPTELRSNVKFSVDTQEDLDRVRAIDLAMAGKKDYSLAATLEAYRRASDKI